MQPGQFFYAFIDERRTERKNGMDDDKIIDLFLARDERAITETSSKYGAFLFSAAERITASSTDADECVNDTYLQAWNGIPPAEPRGYFRTYLLRITRHAALDICRKRDAEKRSALMTEITEELENCLSDRQTAESAVEYKELGALINRFLKQQKELDRNIFIRRYYMAHSVEQISKSLGINKNRVKSVLFRTRNKLKVYLESEGYFV